MSPAHIVTVVAFDGVNLLDFVTLCDAFRRVRLPDGTVPYDVRVSATEPQIDVGLFSIRVELGLTDLSDAHTVIVPGSDDPSRPPPPDLVAAVRAAAERGVRVSIRTGSLVHADAGLPDERVTTRWLGAAALAWRMPSMVGTAGVLHVDRGRTVAVAGGATALDVCLHLIQRDHGVAIAAHLARSFAMPLEHQVRAGQGVGPGPGAAEDGGSLWAVLRWAEDHLDESLSNRALAQRANMSLRTLARRFHQQVGISPAYWVTSARVRRARALLEWTDIPVTRIAAAVGFGSPATFRARFRELVGMSPQRYRGSFSTLGVLATPMKEATKGVGYAGPEVSQRRRGTLLEDLSNDIDGPGLRSHPT